MAIKRKKAVALLKEKLKTLPGKKVTLKEYFTPNPEPRPARMEKPDASGVGPYTREWPGFYIGDQLEHILVDKYGPDRGEKNFNDLISGSFGNAIYTICSNIMREKVKMLRD